MLVLILAYLLRDATVRLPSWCPAVALLCGGAILTAIAIINYEYCNQIGDVDMACYTQAFWNFAHRSLYLTLFENSAFGGHANYLGMVFVPFFLAGGNIALILAQSACLIGAIYLLVFRTQASSFDKTVASAALLFAPPVAAFSLFGFHSDAFGAPLLALALLAFKKRNLKWFLVLTAMLCYTKEIYSLCIAGLVLYAAAERRNWRWIAYPSLVCTILMALYWFYFVPYFSVTGTNLYGSFLPGSAHDAINNVWRTANFRYCALVLIPFAPLLAGHRFRYILLPFPLLVFYMMIDDATFRDIWRQYSMPVAIMAAAPLLFMPEKKSALARRSFWQR
jgi:uncharacterized membrane protein